MQYRQHSISFVHSFSIVHAFPFLRFCKSSIIQHDPHRYDFIEIPHYFSIPRLFSSTGIDDKLDLRMDNLEFTSYDEKVLLVMIVRIVLIVIVASS